MIILNEQALNEFVEQQLGGVEGGVYRDDTEFCMKEPGDRIFSVVAAIISVYPNDPIILYEIDMVHAPRPIIEVPGHLVTWEHQTNG